MLQNIKVDVIYYKTNTDFEMEFNLCGCCRMRLLTDKSPDPKTLIHSMARAVSRSRVIIVVGGLFGDDGIIKLAAGALKNSLCLVDNKTYGIEDGEAIEILDGSTPLVTPEGYFGGCIIESGPQTLVLISDNKNVRKSVMQTLIHPYIEELSTAQIKPDSQEMATEEEPNEEVSEVADSDIVTEEAPQVSDIEFAQETEDETAEDTQPEEQEADIIISANVGETSEEAPETEDDDIIISGAVETETENQDDESDSKDDIISFTPEFSDMLNQMDDTFNTYDDYDDFDDDAEYRKQKFSKSLSLNLPILIVAVLLLITLAVLSYCIFYVPTREGVASATYLRQIFETLFG